MDNPNPTETSAQTGKHTNPWAVVLSIVSVGGLLCVLVILLANMIEIPPLWLWGIIVIALILLLVGLGLGANHKVYGVFIDTRNRVSLSRLQITIWTVLALSAYLAIALTRSMPGALQQPDADAIEKCKTAYLVKAAGDQGLDKWLAENPAQARATEENAAEECTSQPLQISFPPELLLALGISTASFAGSSLVQSIKRNRKDIGLTSDLQKKVKDSGDLVTNKKQVLYELNAERGNARNIKVQAEERKKQAGRSQDDLQKDDQEILRADIKIQSLDDTIDRVSKELDAAQKALEEAQTKWQIEDREKQGLLKVNEKPEQATLSDLFQGDEIGNYNLIDISKVQMFFFTIALVVAYGVALAELLQNQPVILEPFGVSLPPFSSSLNTLLGISHAGYLSVKSIDHTKTE